MSKGIPGDLKKSYRDLSKPNEISTHNFPKSRNIKNNRKRKLKSQKATKIIKYLQTQILYIFRDKVEGFKNINPQSFCWKSFEIKFFDTNDVKINTERHKNFKLN